jgi:hypothetical protein
MFDGVKNAFPMYLLSPDEVVDRIVAAIQQEEQVVVIPWRGNLIYLTKMLPVSVQDNFGKLIGLHSQMSDFKGKGIK